MNAKIKMCQYVIFIKRRQFDTAHIKWFTVFDYLLTGYGESSDHESEESSDDDVSIGKRKGRTGSGISLPSSKKNNFLPMRQILFYFKWCWKILSCSWAETAHRRY